MWCSQKTCLLGVIIGFLCLTQVPSSDGANILGIFTSHSPSHFIIHMSVVKALAEQGHNVTVVSTMKPKVTHKAIHHIIIEPSQERLDNLDKSMSVMTGQKNNIVNLFYAMFTSMSGLIEMQVEALQDERFTRLYDLPDTKFDLVIMGFFFNDYQVGFAAKFNCPIIVDWMSAPMVLVNELVGNPEEPAYVPNMNMGVRVGERMGFFKRLQNYVSTWFFELMQLVLDYRMQKYYDQLFAHDKNLPSFQDMKKKVSLVFCNSHFSEGPVRPNVPALVEIGGIQIKDKPDKLPDDISKFLESSKQHGAILLSLGSNLKGKHVNPQSVQAIFKVFSNLKQNIIWKWDDLENTPGKSPNILYKKWLPQDDILAHPNIKLFVTHAGKGGITESQYHGVPMVALPVFADQSGNAEKMVASGYGLQLEMLTLKEDEFKAAVLEVLSNPKYAKNIKKFSNLYRDRPLSAKESVVFWTEYILRHHGATHMQSPLVHLNYFQSTSLDVIGFLSLVLFVVFKLIKFGCKCICKIFKGKSKAQTKSKKVKKN